MVLAKEQVKLKGRNLQVQQQFRVCEVLNDLSKEHFQFDVSQCEEMKDCYISHKCKLRVERLIEYLQKKETEKNTLLDHLL